MAGDEKEGSWIIEGIRCDGGHFRPSDWIERISDALASFGSDHRLHYDNEVQPCVILGQKCLLVGKSLHSRNPALFAYIMKFAEDNRLRIQEDRRSRDLPMSIERRSGKE